MVKKLFFIATLLYIGATASAESYQVKSPDGKIVAELNTDKTLLLVPANVAKTIKVSAKTTT